MTHEPSASRKAFSDSELDKLSKDSLRALMCLYAQVPDEAVKDAHSKVSAYIDALIARQAAIAASHKPVNVSLEECGDALADEMKEQNLCADKDIGKTTYQTLVCVDGIACARRLAKAVLESAIKQGANIYVK